MNPMRDFTIPVMAVLLLAVAIPTAAQRAEPKKEIIQGEPMYTVLRPGAIPAIFEPKFVTVDAANELYYDDEPLLVVVDGDSAKGYSTWHLDGHEVVNDFINGSAIAVTW